MSITYDEVLKELEKYRKQKNELTEEQLKLVEEARKMNVPWPDITRILNDKYKMQWKSNTLHHYYRRKKE